MTHEVMTGWQVARRQFMRDSRRGSLRCTVWERKFVIRRVLYWKKRAEET
jgi:hypothetical protein